MKRPTPWEDDTDESSSYSSEFESEDSETAKKSKKAPGKFGKRKSNVVDFDELKKHGYRGGLSVLKVPAPKEDTPRDWSWSTGKERRDEAKDTEESFAERQKTRNALMEAEELKTALTAKEKKNLSYSQKEKRKRDLGQASRGKNYVEEEKRLLRESGIYSSFDT